MRPRTRRLPNALRVALAVATIVSTYRALCWSYRTLCPAGRRAVAMARSEMLFDEGLEAMHVRGDRHGALRAWSDEIDIYRAHPGGGKMLIRTRRYAKPGIVGQIEQPAGTDIVFAAYHAPWEYRLETDQRPGRRGAGYGYA